MNPLNAWNVKVCAGLIVMAVCWATAPNSDGPVERDGNIFVRGADRSETQVTSSGADSDPELSYDGRKVVFVRKVGQERREIWIANTTSKTASPRPLVKMPLEIGGRKFNQAFGPRFSPDGTTVFFLIPYAATTEAILRVAVANPEPKFIAAALKFQVIAAGQYRGHLVAQIRKAKLAPGYYEWYWLLTPDGRELGLVGEDEGDVAMFMEMQEEPKAPIRFR